MRGEIIWNKAASASPSTAWGSWLSASNPILRDIHEYILVFSKGDYNRIGKGKYNTITKEQFMDWTKSIWTMNAESARRIGHPAPFPIELPLRLIQLYSFKGDIILDPFMGSGTTAVSAIKSERNFVGYDISQEYIDLAEKRISPFLKQTRIEFELPDIADTKKAASANSGLAQWRGQWVTKLFALNLGWFRWTGKYLLIRHCASPQECYHVNNGQPQF